MAISVIAASAVAVAGSTGTASVNTTPVMPVGTASGDRVFLCIGHTPDTTAVDLPTSWTSVGTAQVGTGAIASAAGTRRVTIFSRDYDGVWTTPAVTLPSSDLPTLTVVALTLRKAASETWDAATFTSGSDTSTNTNFSAAGGAIDIPTGCAVVATAVTSDNVTATVPTLTASGVTFTGLAENADGGSANGNDCGIKVHTALVTTGAASVAATHGLTLSAASDGGVGFVEQSVSAPLTMEKRTPENRARFRAANW